MPPEQRTQTRGTRNVLPCMREWYEARQPKPVAPAPKPVKTPLVRNAVTDDEHRAIEAIGHVTYCPATGTKRFAGQIQGAKELTDGQRQYLWRVVHRFRRQIADKSLVALAKSKLESPAAIAPERSFVSDRPLSERGAT